MESPAQTLRNARGGVSRGHGRIVLVAPVRIEQLVARCPLLAIPEEATDKEVAIHAGVDGAEEEHPSALPSFWYKMQAGQKKV